MTQLVPQVLQTPVPVVVVVDSTIQVRLLTEHQAAVAPV
jgi:hypothetical protein